MIKNIWTHIKIIISIGISIKSDHTTASEVQQTTLTMKTMKPTMHHVREDETHETTRKNNTKAA
jgi:hypothetical protein